MKTEIKIEYPVIGEPTVNEMMDWVFTDEQDPRIKEIYRKAESILLGTDDLDSDEFQLACLIHNVFQAFMMERTHVPLEETELKLLN